MSKSNRTVLSVKRYGKGVVRGRNPERSCSLFLQRQGCSTTLNCSHSLFHIELTDAAFGKVLAVVSYSNDTKIYGTRFAGQVCFSQSYQCIEVAKQKLPHQIRKHFSCDVSFAKQVVSYAHCFGSYEYQKEDVIFSPLKLTESGIKDSVGNVVFDTLSNGVGDAREAISSLKLQLSSVEDVGLKNALEKALELGFHDCDFKKGVQYCYERLTWLAGQYLFEADMNIDGLSNCYILNKDMSEEVAVV